MAKQSFRVEAKDRHTDQVLALELGENESITSQAAAEVYVFTMPASVGGKHPGLDVKPKDRAKFDEVLSDWQKAHPDDKPRGEVLA